MIDKKWLIDFIRYKHIFCYLSPSIDFNTWDLLCLSILHIGLFFDQVFLFVHQSGITGNIE